VLLDHYRDLRIPAGSEESETVTQDGVEMLRRKVQETRKLQAVLRAEAAMNAALLAKLGPLVPSTTGTATADSVDSSMLQRSIATASTSTDASTQNKGGFSFLTSAPSAGTLGISTTGTPHQPLAQNTRFAMSQLPALRVMLQELRPYVSEVPRAERSEAAETRDQYVDAQSRKAMGRRLAGTDLVGGAPDLGRRIEPAEVRALEAMVAGMSGNNRGSGVADGDRMEE